MTASIETLDNNLSDWAQDLKQRLDLAAQAETERDTGDHILNPGIDLFAHWEKPPRDAAVLIGLRNSDAGPSVMLTQRTGHLNSHAGQVAFPGGKIDPEDKGPVDAALREAYEEIGLDPLLARPLGSLAPYFTGSGYRIIPVVAAIDEPVSYVPNPNEVEDVFEVPFQFLMDPANHQKQSRVWNGQRRYFYEMPFADRYIWGVTAGIIRSLYDTVYR